MKERKKIKRGFHPLCRPFPGIFDFSPQLLSQPKEKLFWQTQKGKEFERLQFGPKVG